MTERALTLLTTAPTLLERFYRRIKVNDSGCHEWTGTLHVNGYGIFVVRKRKFYAHRFAWVVRHQCEIGDGLLIDHLCRNRRCANPDHLRAVTSRENTLADGSLSPSNFHSKKTHCPRGHAYSGENLYIHPDGSRRCKECNRIWLRARHARIVHERSLHAAGKRPAARHQGAAFLSAPRTAAATAPAALRSGVGR